MMIRVLIGLLLLTSVAAGEETEDRAMMLPIPDHLAKIIRKHGFKVRALILSKDGVDVVCTLSECQPLPTRPFKVKEHEKFASITGAGM